MKARRIMTTSAALAALLTFAGNAGAAGGASSTVSNGAANTSAFTLGVHDDDATTAVAVSDRTSHSGSVAQTVLAPAATLASILSSSWTSGPAPGTRYDGLRYRERGRRPRALESASVSQIHGGFLDPDGSERSGFLLGLRAGPQIDQNVQVGGMIDWAHKSDNQSTIISRQPGPGGSTIETRREVSRSSSDLVPIMGFIQLSTDDNMPIIPYFGAGGGYEVRWLSAKDLQTGDDFSATYGGWGWELWGGVAMPLSGRSRLTGEVFVNGAELGRDVDDPLTGDTFRETVKADGVGMRFGLAWGF